MTLPRFAVSIVGHKRTKHQDLIANELYLITEIDAVMPEDAVWIAERQFRAEASDYTIISSTWKEIRKANPPQNGSRENAKDLSGRPRGRHMEAGRGQG